MPKLGQLREQVAAPIVQEGQTLVEEELPRDAFEFETLKSLWQSFAQKKKEASKNQEFIILNQDFELLDQNIIKIKLNSDIQMDTIDRLKSELMPYLREQLNNHQIKLQAEVVMEEESEMIYTAAEKFKYLMKKHPPLRKLQERLGLDPE